MARKTRLDILRGAREILRDPDKWGKGFSYYSGRFCLSGALCQISFGDPAGTKKSIETVRVLRRKYAKLMGIKGRSMMDFNDDGNTTHKMVLAAIQRGIRNVKKELAKRRARA